MRALIGQAALLFMKEGSPEIQCGDEFVATSNRSEGHYTTASRRRRTARGFRAYNDALMEWQAIRGMHDMLPERTRIWHGLARRVAGVMDAYDYQPIHLPAVEATALFERCIGAGTDIVHKEMYTFADRNGDSLTLRPEGTAGCVRACLQHGLLGGVRRLWYSGPMFRHERPQRGRSRQFHQAGAESFGAPGPEMDAELIAMTARVWRLCGVADSLTLEINSIGERAARERYAADIRARLSAHAGALDEDSQRQLQDNPLRLLDSKNPELRALSADWPPFSDYLDDACRAHFDALRALLDGMGIRYRVAPRLVRGLDYYNRTVFEWVTERLGAQGTVAAGGRYDGLVAQLGGPDTPACGFAIGLERLCMLVQEAALPDPVAPAVPLCCLSERWLASALQRAEKFRDALPALRLNLRCGGSLKSHLRYADRQGARLALVLGDREAESSVLLVRCLRDAAGMQAGSQQTLGDHDTIALLQQFLDTSHD